MHSATAPELPKGALLAIQGSSFDVGGDISSLSLDKAGTDCLVSLEAGPPVLISRGKDKQLPDLPSEHTHAALSDDGQFAVLVSDKGLLVVVTLKAMRVLDAVQVCGPFVVGVILGGCCALLHPDLEATIA